uniref:Uncharacterized protein n=1 Tax=Arundo donax TaxID=35708 RepID=A0A0A9EET9_ARUDO
MVYPVKKQKSSKRFVQYLHIITKITKIIKTIFSISASHNENIKWICVLTPQH